jgi:hypothetical protein
VPPAALWRAPVSRVRRLTLRRPCRVRGSARDERRQPGLRGPPAVVIVSGEAGVGKPRLVEEAGAAARAAGGRLIAGGCVELGADAMPA